MRWCQTKENTNTNSLVFFTILLAVHTTGCSAMEHPRYFLKDIFILRGGNEENKADVTKYSRQFWNPAALFELYATAKEDALVHDSEPKDPAKGRRGGALTVQRPSRKFLSFGLGSRSLGSPNSSLQEERPILNDISKNSSQPMLGISKFWWANIRGSMFDDFPSDDLNEELEGSKLVSHAESEKPCDNHTQSDHSMKQAENTGKPSKKRHRKISKVANVSELQTSNITLESPEDSAEKEQKELSTMEKAKPQEVKIGVQKKIGYSKEDSNNSVIINGKQNDTYRVPLMPEGNTSNLDDSSKDILNSSNVDDAEEKRLEEDTATLQYNNKKNNNLGPEIVVGDSQYVSSGVWRVVDGALSLGLSFLNPNLRISRPLRPVRKFLSKVTRLHGVLSGKPSTMSHPEGTSEEEMEILDEEDLGMIRRRIVAIERARKLVELKEDVKGESEGRNIFNRRRSDDSFPTVDTVNKVIDEDNTEISQLSSEENPAINDEIISSQRRVMEIDRLITSGQKKLFELACEKDALQRRPNPLYNYTTTKDEVNGSLKFTRQFSFPSESLVEDYLDDLFAHGRLIKMNHTHLWKSGIGFDDEEDESIGDDLLTPSADASRLYTEYPKKTSQPYELRTGNGGGGSWILRQSIGKGGSLGEKIGETTEMAGYKAVCRAIMTSLARMISALHGINVMAHSDIRLFMEQIPDLPPISKNALPRNDYAEEAIKGAILKSRKRKKKGPKISEETFMQRDAVVETLLSHCQISAPLLKLFPLAWQRALLANMITLITHVISDFAEGIEFQILGHSLTFSFKPITESDMIRHIGLAGKGINHRRTKPEEFEAAVRATSEDVSQSLKILDRWHERALGSGMLRNQIANLIARLVLTLADEVLSGARMDLWAAQAGGPRVLAGLEYRTTYMETN